MITAPGFILKPRSSFTLSWLGVISWPMDCLGVVEGVKWPTLSFLSSSLNFPFCYNTVWHYPFSLDLLSPWEGDWLFSQELGKHYSARCPFHETIERANSLSCSSCTSVHIEHWTTLSFAVQINETVKSLLYPSDVKVRSKNCNFIYPAIRTNHRN